MQILHVSTKVNVGIEKTVGAMPIAGIETMMAVIAILSASAKSSGFFRIG
jgi:hypothetical protein